MVVAAGLEITFHLPNKCLIARVCATSKARQSSISKEFVWLHLRLMSSMRSALRWVRHGSLAGEHPADMGGPRDHIDSRPHSTGPDGRRRCDLRLCRRYRAAIGQHCPHRLAFSRPTVGHPRNDSRQTMRIFTASRPLRSASGHERDPRCGACRRCAEHVLDSYLGGNACRQRVRIRHALQQVPGVGSTIRRGRNLTVRRRRPDCQEMGYQP